MKYMKKNYNFNIISKNLYKYRKEKGMSQEELSREMTLRGINMYRNDIYKIEYNKRYVRDYELLELMNILNVTFEELTADVNKDSKD